MPQATDELRAKMNARFGDPISDEGPWDFLKERGWQCVQGLWRKDPMPARDAIPADEWDCLIFLIQEWDHDIWPEA